MPTFEFELDENDAPVIDGVNIVSPTNLSNTISQLKGVLNTCLKRSLIPEDCLSEGERVLFNFEDVSTDGFPHRKPLQKLPLFYLQTHLIPKSTSGKHEPLWSGRICCFLTPEIKRAEGKVVLGREVIYNFKTVIDPENRKLICSS